MGRSCETSFRVHTVLSVQLTPRFARGYCWLGCLYEGLCSQNHIHGHQLKELLATKTGLRLKKKRIKKTHRENSLVNAEICIGMGPVKELPLDHSEPLKYLPWNHDKKSGSKGCVGRRNHAFM